jgi:hypothetical protein
VALPHLRIPSALRAVAGWVGLALVVSCGFVLPASAAFPGYVALWPTLGAALVILSGGARTRFGVDRILASRPLVALGDISFSFYLWHWPVLVFYLIVIDKTQAGIRGGLGVIAVSLLGAFLTHRLVEAPIHSRLKRTAPLWHPHAVAVACVVPVLAFAAVSSAAIEEDPEELSGPLSASLGARSADYPGGTLPVSLAKMHDPKVAIYPSPATAKRFTKPYRRDCHQKGDLPEVITCSYGVAEGATKTVAVVGGSHSVHWIPAFEILAGEHRWHVVSITKSACPFEVNALRRPSCIQWNEDVHAVLEKIKPDVVFTTSTRSDLESPTNADGVKGRTSERAEAIPEGYLAQWKRLAAKGITVIAVRDNPRMGFDVPGCVEKFYPNLSKCARPRDRLMDRIDPSAELQPPPENVAFIDLTDRFCDEDLCYPVAGNVLIYRDKHHIGSAYARTLAPVLGERMKEVRPDLFDGGASPRREAGVL